MENNYNNQNIQLKKVLEKLQSIQNSNQHNNNINIMKHNSGDFNSISNQKLKEKLLELRQRRVMLQKKKNDEVLQTKEIKGSDYSNIEFLIEKGYSKDSYKKLTQNLDSINRIIIEMENNSHFFNIIKTNFLLKENLFNSIDSFVKLKQKFENIFSNNNKNQLENLQTQEFINNIENKINDITRTGDYDNLIFNNQNFSKTNFNSVQKIDSSNDLISEIEKELSLIDGILEQN